ncbi:translation initiation factor IF-2 [Conexibacter sp. CPCC 206217]|uniref:translation initiation factor IF-2 n=1 Tax=Conexibacter sp. CPCC 206217 TaxID=3064574 RepID=UPI00271D37E7|nr:translation initiation factor IF-2 [Conexibacter sp. CPCC 206217]MDO8210698.1 translation initiation factor IF-2 [Conexibacter sp. CPCC 206217]
MSNKRVSDIAKEHGISAGHLIATLRSAGLNAPTPSSSVDESAALRVLDEKGLRRRTPPTRARVGTYRDRNAPERPRVVPRVRTRMPAPGTAAAGNGGQQRTGGPGGSPRGQGGPGGQRGPGGPGQRGGQRPGGRPGEGPRGGGRPGDGPPPARTDGTTPNGEPRQRPTRDSLGGGAAGAAGGGRRRVVIDSQASRRAPGGGPMNQPPRRQRRGRRRRGTYEEPAPLETRVSAGPAHVKIASGSTVKDVAEYLDIPIPEIIKKLMQLGEMATLTQTLSDDAIEMLASEFDRTAEVVHAADDVDAEPEYDDSEDELVERAPVVTIMGHVDHGKTSLLDAIRDTEVTAGEAGGITQHIGAYQVHHADREVTFLDTPGHEAFTAMRARGAKVTDIAVIVVAADDGVKPQTQEAVDHAKAARVPILVAVNKIDKEGAQPDRVRTEMTQLGLQPVEWGGEIEFVDVSAKTKRGLDNLLDTILVMSEVEELRANPNAEASGIVVESKLDPGRGAVATVLIQRGTLHVGDALFAGPHWGKVRAMNDFLGQRVKRALPGEPVEILGFDTVPEAGETVRVVENDRKARQLAGERANRLKTEARARRSGKRISLEDIFKSELQELNLVLKADVAGSLEAIEDEIAKLPQDEISVNVVHRGVGGVNESDVMLAAASEGVVLAFNVRPIGDAARVADREGVEIRSYAVIYRAIEELRAAMEGMLEPEEVEDQIASIEVRAIFRASRIGVIAGSYVTEGRVTRGARVRLVRDGTVVYDGEIASLKRFNEDVREVATGFECGIVLRDFADVKEGDLLEAYTTRKVERELA